MLRKRIILRKKTILNIWKIRVNSNKRVIWNWEILIKTIRFREKQKILGRLKLQNKIIRQIKTMRIFKGNKEKIMKNKENRNRNNNNNKIDRKLKVYNHRYKNDNR